LNRRKQYGRNWTKTKMRLAHVHARIDNVRRDASHKLTAGLVRDFRRIGVEDLNVSGMLRNGRLAKSIADAAVAEVLRQLTYKAVLAGSTVVVADRWFPSSKTCSTCGVVYTNLQLSERRWICRACGAEHDRDENAAKNLEALAVAHTVAACCQGSAGVVRKSNVKLPLGQESGNDVNHG
jgi:putative transposase